MKNVLAGLIAIVLVSSNSIAADRWSYSATQNEAAGNADYTSGNLILGGSLLLIGAAISGKNASDMRSRGEAESKHEGRFAAGQAIGMFAGILCLAVGISIRF